MYIWNVSEYNITEKRKTHSLQVLVYGRALHQSSHSSGCPHQEALTNWKEIKLKQFHAVYHFWFSINQLQFCQCSNCTVVLCFISACSNLYTNSAVILCLLGFMLSNAAFNAIQHGRQRQIWNLWNFGVFLITYKNTSYKFSDTVIIIKHELQM